MLLHLGPEGTHRKDLPGMSIITEDTEKEFERFHQRRSEKKEARITSLKKSANKKRSKVQERRGREILSLTERVKEMEEEMQVTTTKLLKGRTVDQAV